MRTWSLHRYTHTNTHPHTHLNWHIPHMHVFNYSTSFDAAFINSSPRSWVADNFLLSTSHYPLSIFHFLLTAYSLLLVAFSHAYPVHSQSLESSRPHRGNRSKVQGCLPHTHTGTLSLSHTHTRKIIKLFILMQTFLLLQATVNYTPSALCAQQQQNKIKTWLTTQRNANFLLKRN